MYIYILIYTSIYEYWFHAVGTAIKYSDIERCLCVNEIEIAIESLLFDVLCYFQMGITKLFNLSHLLK